jgi:hypothetical protein
MQPLETPVPIVCGAVDRVKRVDAVLIEIEHAGAERIVDAGRHAAGILDQRRIAPDLIPGRRPGRPFGLAPDIGVAAPQEPGAADIGAVAGGGAFFFDAVDEVFAGIDMIVPGASLPS